MNLKTWYVELKELWMFLAYGNCVGLQAALCDSEPLKMVN